MIKVTTGDTQPLLTLAFTTTTTDPLTGAATTAPTDLTTAVGVVWHFVKGSTDTPKTATISDADNGLTTWQWDGTLTAGVWRIIPVVTWNDTSTETGDEALIDVRAAA